MTVHYKHNIWRELWLNRPWVYIPAVVYWMREFPYQRDKDYFWNWLRNCLYLNWQASTYPVYEED